MDIKKMEWPLSKEELEYLYLERGMSHRDIGVFFNMTRGGVRYWVKKHNIKTRNPTRRKSTKQFKKEVYNLVSDEYTVLGEYVKTHFKIKIKHNDCGNVYKVQPSSFLAGRRCPECANTTRKTTQEFKKEVYELVGNKYTVLEEYINKRSKIKIRHNDCGYEYQVTPSGFLQNCRCPKCAARGLSRGEKIIIDYLKQNNIKQKWQYKFKDCKNIRHLIFDVKIKDEPIVIEYNGKQHYEPVAYFGGKKQFNYQQKNDKIKKQYCKENNVKLIEIPYWEKDNIEEILEKELMLD